MEVKRLMLDALIEDLIEELDYETIKNEIQTDIKQRFNNDLTFIESDSFSLIVEAFIYREMQLRARINQSIKNSFAIINTDDTNNTAGAEMAYKRAIKEVSQNIKDIKVYSDVAGVVEVVFHSDEDLIQEILNHLNNDQVKPLTDIVNVTKATILVLNLEFEISYHSGANITFIESEILKAFGKLKFTIGQNLSCTKALSLVHLDGVYKATTTFEDTDIEKSQIIEIGNIVCNFKVLDE